jgi:predicted nucleic acid-binding protein
MGIHRSRFPELSLSPASGQILSASADTRSLDVLHVASALVLHAETFYTFDEKQRKLAKAEGLLAP